MNSITPSVEKTKSTTKPFLIDANVVDGNEESNRQLKVSIVNRLNFEHRRMLACDLDFYKRLLARSFAFNYKEHPVPSNEGGHQMKFDNEAAKSCLFTDTDFMAFFEDNGHFNKKIFDNPCFAYNILKQAKSLLQTMPNIRECHLEFDDEQIVQDTDPNSCIIVGDLCGSLNDFSYLIEEFGVPGSKHKFIFNGNLVRLDTQPKNQIDLLLLVCYAFIQRPDRVFINRGSNEDIYSSLVHLLDSDQPSLLQLIRQRYDVYSTAIFNEIIDLFGHLSLGTILINKLTKIFIINSGINDTINIEFIQNKVKRHEIVDLTKFDNENEVSQVIRYMFESTPRRNYNRNNDDDETDSYRCYKPNYLEFSEQQTEEFCELNDLSCIIRSNELVKDGFSLDHPKCFTVFSASNYYDSNNMGAILKLTANETALEPYIYSNNNLNENKISSYLNVRDQLKYLVQLNKKDLYGRFELRDKLKMGSLKFDQFSNVLVEHFGTFNIAQIKEHFMDEYMDKESNNINYSNLFNMNQHDALNSRHLIRTFVNAFNMLDIDDDKRVSLVELKEALGFFTSTDEKFHLSDKSACKCIIEKLENASAANTTSNTNQIGLNEFNQLILNVIDADIVVKDNELNLGDEDEVQNESYKEFIISSEHGNEESTDGEVDEDDEEGEEEAVNDESDDNENDGDSKSINSESSEDGPLQLVRL